MAISRISRAELRRLHRRFIQATERLNRNISQVSSNRARVIGFLINQKLALEGHLERIVKRRFDTQGSSGGRSWPALRSSTIDQRAALGFPSGPALVRSGALKDAAVRGIITVGEDELTIDMKDGPAPRYRKLGKFKITAGGGQLSDYAAGLNAKRPFYGPPTKQELEPLNKRKKELLTRAVNALLSGKSLVAAIK